MDKKFEKILIILMICAVLALPILNKEETYAEINDGIISSDGMINQYPGIMRFHVVANSNSEEDQQIKLVVRNYVLSKVQNEIIQAINHEVVETDSQNEMESSQGTTNDAILSRVMRDYIKNNLDRIDGWAQEVLNIAGFDYSASSSMGIRHIPAKYYDDLFFPEGNYEALTITLGEGSGENWWCVVFPPLCLIDSDDSAYSSEFDIKEEDRLILKFKTEELLDDDSDHHSTITEELANIIKKSVEKSADFSFLLTRVRHASILVYRYFLLL